MNNFKHITSVLALTALLAACGGQPGKVKKYYRLSTDFNTTEALFQADTVVVKRPSALSILGGRPMVATQNDGSLVQLSHHFWLESPKVLLQDKFKSWANIHWQQVTVQTPGNGQYHVLHSRILAFEKQQNQALVTIEFSIYDQDQLLLANHQLSATTQINGEGYKAFVVALSQSLEAVLQQLSASLNKEL